MASAINKANLRTNSNQKPIPVPPLSVGEVSDSILWILGQALLYAASVFGVSAYFRSETVQLKRDMDRHLEHMERMQIQREKLRRGMDVEEIPIKDEEDE